jgi:hypothetical protein
MAYINSLNAPQSVSPTNSVSPIMPIRQPSHDEATISKSSSTSSTCSVSSIVSPVNEAASNSNTNDSNTNDINQIRPQFYELFPVRVIIVALWLLFVQMVVSNTLIATSIFIFIKNATTCCGILAILAMIVVPVAYTLRPDIIINFKFASLAPQIADGLRKLDYFVNRFIRATSKKLESGK